MNVMDERCKKNKEDKKQIESELDITVSNAAQMLSVVLEVENRLSEVLQDPTPSTSCENSELPYIVPLASRIRDVNTTILSGIHHMEDIINRLEL